MELIETQTFTKQIRTLVNEEQYRKFQVTLAENPSRGSIIKGSGGIRKTRIATTGKGKSGGARVIYYWARKDLILLLFAYSKNESTDLTPTQLKQLSAIVRKEF